MAEKEFYPYPVRVTLLRFPPNDSMRHFEHHRVIAIPLRPSTTDHVDPPVRLFVPWVMANLSDCCQGSQETTSPPLTPRGFTETTAGGSPASTLTSRGPQQPQEFSSKVELFLHLYGPFAPRLAVSRAVAFGARPPIPQRRGLRPAPPLSRGSSQQSRKPLQATLFSAHWGLLYLGERPREAMEDLELDENELYGDDFAPSKDSVAGGRAGDHTLLDGSDGLLEELELESSSHSPGFEIHMQGSFMSTSTTIPGRQASFALPGKPSDRSLHPLEYSFVSSQPPRFCLAARQLTGSSLLEPPCRALQGFAKAPSSTFLILS